MTKSTLLLVLWIAITLCGTEVSKTAAEAYMPMALHFYGKYFVHGEPYYEGGEKILSDASGGCIQLQDSDAIAFYDMGEIDAALASIEKASETVRAVTKEDWLTAYPGNDPAIAHEGIETLRASIESNMHMIQRAIATRATP